MKEQLGKVSSVYLGKEDHGILSFMIHLDFGGAGQGFGGYALDQWSKELKRRAGSAAGTDLILQLINIFNVDSLDKIVGRPVYAIRTDDSWNSSIIGLKTPDFDGGKLFLISDWQELWFPEMKDKI